MEKEKLFCKGRTECNQRNAWTDMAVEGRFVRSHEAGKI